jgi:endonuclease YncB( thermonuclease family)
VRSAAFLFWLCVASCTPTPSAFAVFPHISTTAGPGIIHGCYDGDTCTISIPGLPSVFGEKLGLRLMGIDTPEMQGKCDQERALAKQAKAFLNSRLEAAYEINVNSWPGINTPPDYRGWAGPG